MEETNEIPAPGTRQLNLKKSFKLGLRSLLTTSSKEEFCRAFPRFTNAEQERLHRLFIQVITSLHENIEDDFESLCNETQAGSTLDTIEQLVEEQSLDPLFTDKSNVGDVSHSLSLVKKNEVQHLMNLLEKAEEHNRIIRARVEFMKNKRQDFSSSADVVEKLRTRIFELRSIE